MPRPKGSKNKATLAKQTQTATKPAAKATSTAVADPVMAAMEAFEDKLTNCGETVVSLLRSLTEDFTALQKRVGSVPASKETVVSAKSGRTEPEEDEDEVDIASMTVEELEEFIEENDLDVDLDDYKGLSKKRKAVEDAYEEFLGDVTDEDGSDDEDEESDDDEDEDEDEESDDDEDDDWDDDEPKAKTPVKKGKTRR